MNSHDAAHKYVRRGWRVVPIVAGSKRPALTKWTEQATTDPELVDSWWGGEHSGCGVGIVTGPESGVWVLDVDDLDSLADLEYRYEKLPETLTSLTGSGGTHLFFRWPDDGRDIRNDAGRRLGHKLDVRGAGGQVVAPPTLHPSGVQYQWDAGMPQTPADAPDWLLELVTMQEPTLSDREVRDVVERTDRPGDRWAAATSWAELLTADGWTLHHQDRTGECYWTRPGKDPRDGASATTGYGGSGGLKVFTSSLSHFGLEPEATYSKLGYLAATRFDGDHSAAAAFLSANGWGETDGSWEKELTAFLKSMESKVVTEAVSSTLEALPAPSTDDSELEGRWDFIDLRDVLEGEWDPPRPTLLRRDDTVGMLYEGKVHSLAGEPGGGKTWVALAAIAETVADGGTALFVDYEDSPDSFAARLRSLGMSDDDICDHVVYVRPTGPLLEVDRRRLLSLDVQLAVIDSVGESLAVEGENPNDDDAVTRWLRLLPRPLSQAGASVLLVDHVTKNGDTRGLWAIGSQRKLAGISGAAYMLEVKVAPTKETTGRMVLLCAKDRHGTHQKGRIVAEVEVSAGENVRVTVKAPEANPMPQRVMERVSVWLEAHGPASSRQVRENVTGKAETIKSALAFLEQLGHVRNERSESGFEWTFVSPYREGMQMLDALRNVRQAVENPVDNREEPPSGSPVPGGSPAVPGTTSGGPGSPVPWVIGSQGTGNHPDPGSEQSELGGGSPAGDESWETFWQ